MHGRTAIPLSGLPHPPSKRVSNPGAFGFLFPKVLGKPNPQQSLPKNCRESIRFFLRVVIVFDRGSYV
jgi:hypothetical protein